MKILHIISSLETGGAQKLLSELVPVQISLGNIVEILVYKNCKSKIEEDLIKSGVTIHSLQVQNIKSLNIFGKIRKYISLFDIIHVHLFPTLYQVAIANFRGRDKLIYTEHSTYNRRRKYKVLRFFEKLIYNRYAKIIAISHKTKENLVIWLGINDQINNKIGVITNGINLKLFSSNSDIHDERFILMVSRFTAAKDQSTLIRAIPYIKDKRIKIKFAGEGPTLEACKKLVSELRLEDRCVFLGNRSDIPDLVKASYLGVQSSHWEGFGLTAVEFMAARKPIIASDVEGLSQIVEGAGLLFPKGNHKSLAQKINDLMIDTDKYELIANRCFAKAKEFDIIQMAQKYNNLYKSIL